MEQNKKKSILIDFRASRAVMIGHLLTIYVFTVSMTWTFKLQS